MLGNRLVVPQRWLGRLWKRTQGQDLIEYALLAGFVAVAVAFIFPTSIGPSITNIMGKVSSILNSAPTS